MLLQLKIQIKGVTKPPVWRRILVPADFTFDRLHSVIQQAFGWESSHLYQFSPKGFGSKPEIGISYDDDWEGTIADAILDRVVNSSHRIDLKGHSLRKGILNQE